MIQNTDKEIKDKEFKEMTIDELKEVLSLTIKQDDTNKLIAFLCCLSSFTYENQFNISFNAPSSTGKSFIPTQIVKLFPPEDVTEVAYSTPTAFFYEKGEYDKEKNLCTVDLSRKIILFLDQPHQQLLEKLRPLFSHDSKEIYAKITDKSQKFGTRTKNIKIIGYPSVIFCTAGLNIDEQEATRFLLLSPESSQDKIYFGITESIKKELDNRAYQTQLKQNTKRQQLKERILSIKTANIIDIKILREDEQYITEQFFLTKTVLKPRYQRDIKRLIAIIKAIALLNYWYRDFIGSTITANKSDIEAGFELWKSISKSQELGLPPYVYEFYNNILLSAYTKKNDALKIKYPNIQKPFGVTRKEITKTNFDISGLMVSNKHLTEILLMLETAGLIHQDYDRQDDKRAMLVYPAYAMNQSK